MRLQFRVSHDLQLQIGSGNHYSKNEQKRVSSRGWKRHRKVELIGDKASVHWL